jgi:uncharacterized protein DUF1524
VVRPEVPDVPRTRLVHLNVPGLQEGEEGRTPMTAAKITPVAVLVTAAVLAGCKVLPAPPDPSAPIATEVDVARAVAELAALPINPEDTTAPYDRDDWPHWMETNGCSTREIVLRTQGRDVVVDEDCDAVSGRWTSAYDGVVVTDASELDVDHMVPLHEVAESGPLEHGQYLRPGDWPRDQRQGYANDSAVLVAVTASSNRSKGDQDPAEWLPDVDQCGYAAHWINVKTVYHLAIDQAEHDALAAVLSGC